MEESNIEKQERFHYINLFKIDYKFKLFQGIFDPAKAISTIMIDNENEKDKNLKKKEKSILSSNTNNKISKKQAKQIQKKNAKKRKNEEEERKEQELMLEKQDSKNGIYLIKPINKKQKEKEKKQMQKITQIKEKQIQYLKQLENKLEREVEMNYEKEDKEINTNQNNNNKKGNKKKNKDKNKNNDFIEQEEKDEKEGNKKVDDFIKSIKAKKEKIEKEKEKENIKINFLNHYKYLFTLDPSNRLKIRDEQKEIRDEIIIDLFNIISKSNLNEKENIKDICILIDSLSEIIFNKKDKNLIDLFIQKCFELINDKINNLFEDNIFSLLLNICYSLMKIKNDNENKFNDIDIGNNIYFSIKEIIQKEINNNQLIDFKNNENLIKSLFFYLIIIYILDKNDLSIQKILIESFSELLQKKENEKETEKQKYDANLDLITTKSKFTTLKLLLKLKDIFDIKKSEFYSLNIKISKSFTDYLSNLQQNIVKDNISSYFEIISLILSHYVYNFDLFYELDYKLYEEVFDLFKYITENEPFISETEGKNNFIKKIKFNILSLTNDDSLSKYLMILMKIFKFFNKQNLDYDLYVDYFSNVLEFVLDIKQSYLHEKYCNLLQRELNDKFNEELVKKILNIILKKIHSISNDKDIIMMRGLKDLIIFYRKFDIIKDECLNLIQNVNSNTINDEIVLLFLISFFDLKYKNIDKFIEIIPFKKLGFINQNVISFLLHHYVNEELKNLNDIIKLYEKKDQSKIYEFIISQFINHIKDNEILLTIDDIKLIEKNKINIPIEKIIEVRNEQNYKLVDSFVIKYINENSICESIFNNYPYKTNLENLIQETNDKNSKYAEKDYLNSLNNIVNILVEIKKIDNLLLKDGDYFKIESVQIEDSQKEEKKENENAENLIEMLTYPVEKESIENKEKEENKEKKEENKEEKKEIEKIENKKPKANIDVIIYIFSEIISMNEFNNLKEIINDNNIEKLNPEYTQNLLLFSQIEQFLYKTLQNNNLFSLLTQSSKLLSSFMKSYIIFKEYFSQNKSFLNNIISQNKKLDILITSKYINNIYLYSLCEEYLTNLIIERCSSQLIYLFPEPEIYLLLQTNNRKFLKSITDSLNNAYQTKILSQENINSLLKKAQDEEVDYLEEVVFEMFNKETIKYLENPKEIIELLVSCNEGLRYDLLPSKNQYYQSIFPYFYIWKSIMNKIQNGFKLYTSNQSHVTLIENYKTLLKFVINYFERNSKLYEMFLLIVISLIHLIDQQENDIDDINLNNSNFENFDENNLTNNFDNNTYLFLLSILFKFVKIFPSLVKFYYDESKNKLKNVFKNLICTLILPKLYKDLRETIKLNEKLLSENKITVGNLILANYLEFKIELNEEIKFYVEIKIPPIFPLKKLDINIKTNVAIDEIKLLNIKLNLNHTLNSSVDNVCDNLIIWKEDIKQLYLAGNEPCPICYFYLNTTDKSLPSLQCHTCHKKFHLVCIKEWFKSQAGYGKETCPMCRSEWKMRK